MTEPTELMPCPFCGSKAKAFKRTCDKDTRYDPADRAFPIVRCGICGASSEGDDWSEPNTAIDRWNRRTQQPTPAQAVAVPLTDEQIEALPLWKRFVGLWPETRREIVRIIESAHGIGIKGGQHGTDA